MELENLFYHSELSQGASMTTLPEEEARHCIKVLRMTVGARLQLVDGKGGRYEGEISSIGKKNVEVSILEARHDPPRPFSLHLAIGPTKNADRMEFFVEKAVEIGIERISFIRSQYSERKHLRLDRIQRVAVSAMKQSQQSWLPQLSEIEEFPLFVRETKAAQRLLAWEGEPLQNMLGKQKLLGNGGEYCILIGPEGGYTEDELTLAEQAGFQKVSLGPNRLRTETAGIVACTLLNHFLLR